MFRYAAQQRLKEMLMVHMRVLVLAVGLFLLLAVSMVADGGAEEAVTVGQKVTLHSKSLDEERSLLIHLPSGYAESSFRYPVLYLLDAESDFLHTAGIVHFLSGTGQIPELIVVGVTNTMRSRDLTPESADEEETSFWPAVGGVDRFLNFFREELIPFIDRSYRTQPYRILRGQSFGGLCAIHDLMSKTPTFEAYLTSSPALGWNYGTLVERAEDFFSKGVTRPLFMAAAGRDFPGNLASIQQFAEIVTEKTSADDPWRYEFFESEEHYSLSHQSSYNGLKFLFRNWLVPDTVAATADFAAYEDHYTALSAEFGYFIKIPMKTVIRLGNQLLRQQRYAEGIAIKRKNLELYPEQPEVYWHVGNAYQLAGDLEEARRYLEMAFVKAKEKGAADLVDYRESLNEIEAKMTSR